MVPELSLIIDLNYEVAESAGSTSPRLFVHAAPCCCRSEVLPCHAEGLQGRGERVSKGALHPGVVQGAQVLRQLLDVLLIKCLILLYRILRNFLFLITLLSSILCLCLFSLYMLTLLMRF